MLSAAVVGDVLYGALFGLVAGSLGALGGGLEILSAVFGATTLSLIGDRINGRDRSFTKAILSGLTAGIFAGLGGSATNHLISGSKELAAKIIVETFGATSFSLLMLLS